LPGTESSPGGGLLDLVQRAGQGALGDVGVVAEGQQGLALALELLHQVHLQVGAAGHLEQFEDGQQDLVMIDRRIAALEMPDTGKEIFKAKESTYALVEWILEINHRLRPFRMAPPQSER
jgi:hypothetical protein